MSRLSFAAGLLFIAATASAIAQTPGAKAAERLRQAQAISLAKQALSDAGTLRLPENKIEIGLDALPVVAESDPELAKSIISDLRDQYASVSSQLPAGTPRYMRFAIRNQQFNLRHRIISAIATVSPAAALDFMDSTRPADLGGNALQQEDSMQAELASQIAAKDAKLALKLAQRSLEGKLNYASVSVVSQLNQSDPVAARSFLGKLLEKVRNTDFSHDPEQLNTALNLLQNLSAMEDDTTSRQPMVTKRMLGNLAEQLIDAAVAPGASPQALQYLNGQAELLKKFAPRAASELVEKADSADLTAPDNNLWSEFQKVNQAGDIQKTVAFITQTPDEMHDNFYQQLAGNSAAQGKFSEATAIIQEHISDPDVREQTLENAVQQAINQAAWRGDSATAISLLNSLKQSPEERAMGLLQIASAMQQKDPKNAAALLEEANQLLDGMAPSGLRLQAQLQLAQNEASLAPQGAEKLLRDAIARINDLTAPAQRLDEFNQYGGYRQFRDGEMLLNFSGLFPSPQIQQVISALRILASKDLAAAASVADDFQQPEARALARVSVAQGASQNGSGPTNAVLEGEVRFGSGSGGGIGIGYLTGVRNDHGRWLDGDVNWFVEPAD